ncbi:MAG TPA: hypothetical protein VE619_08825 [Nitrososphaeraceae archaeon]|nr:hypothetical protein [Nitrososphaeraceae archaeon]
MNIIFIFIYAFTKIKDDLEVIDYKKALAKHQPDDINNQISYLNKISYSGVQELEGYFRGLTTTTRNSK